MILRRLLTVSFFIKFLLASVFLPAQEENLQKKYNPREQNLFIDIPLTIAEEMAINLFGNAWWRLWGPDKEAAYFTLDSMRANLNPKVWTFEAGQGGDTFLTNQFLHPYAGGLYFASARSNNFGFYWSIFSSTLGSLTWEALGETDSPASSDLINTALGGIVLGEILHRLYIELDKGGVGGKIAGTLLSPTDRITAAVRGYGPEKGPTKIQEALLAFGFSHINTRFLENNTALITWNSPSVFLTLDLVYGDPYIQYSKTPFDQFEFTAMAAASITLIHNFNFISNGYLASWYLADDEVNQMSNGLSLHFDDFIVDRGKLIDLNNGTENQNFNALSLDYTLKWRYIISESFELSLKTHLGFSPWAVADYNGGVYRDDYNLYLMGFNVKSFLELRQFKREGNDRKKGRSFTLSICFYDTWNIPRTPGFEINTIFFYNRIVYTFPLTDRCSFYLADNFSVLYCYITQDAGAEFPDILRQYNIVQIGLQLSF